MRDVVFFAVGEEEEAAGTDNGNVVSCSDPELEEVEQAERGHECEKAPYCVACPGTLCSDYQRPSEKDAQPESLSADAGQRSLAIRKQRGIEWDRPAGEGTLHFGSEVGFAFGSNIVCCSLLETMNSLSFRGRG